MPRTLLLLGCIALSPAAFAQTERTYGYDEVQNRTFASNQVRFTSTSALSFRPRRAVLGGRVNIFGRNFDATDPTGHSVTFNGLNAPVLFVGPRVLTVDVPMGATSGAIVVTLPNQTQLSVGDLSVEGVSVTPAVASIFNGDSVQFTSTVTGSSSTDVEWAVNDVVGGSGTLGTISPTGLYTAPGPNVELSFPLLVTARSLDLELRGIAVLEAACSGTGTLVPGVPQLGTIASPTDRFCYSFEAVPGSKMVLGCTGTPTVRLRLRDQDGILIEGTADGTSLSIAPFIAPSGGSYVLNVEAAGAQTGNFTVGIIEVNDPSLAYWVNPGSGLWSDGANWLSGQVPDPSQTARVSFLGAGQSRWFAPSGGIHNLVCDEALTLERGIFTLTGSATTTGTTTVTASSEMLNNGSLVSTGVLNLQGGEIYGRGTVRSSGSLLLSGAAKKTIGAGHTFINEGNATWIDNGDLRLEDGAMLENLAGATLDSQSDTSVENGTTGGDFHNLGTFRKSAGVGATQFERLVTLTNDGLIQSQSGAIRILGGGTNSGQIDAALGARVEFATTPYTLAAGTVISGEGFARVAATGTVLVDGSTTAENFEVSVAGIRSGPAELSVSSVLLWTGGTMTGPGSTVSTGAFEIRGAARKMLEGGHTLRNEGAAMVFDLGDTRFEEGAVLVNAPGANFEFHSDSDIDGVGVGGTFDNQGTFSKVAGAAGTAIGPLVAFDNSGLVEAQQSVLQIRSGGTASGTFHVTGGTLQFFASPYTFLAGTAITGPGSTQLLSGSDLVVVGDSTAENLEVGVSATRSGGADLTVTSSLILSGGALSGLGRTIATGTMDWAAPARKELQGGHTLVNAGAAVLSGNGGMRLQDGSVFENQSGAILDLQTNASIDGVVGGGTIENQGTIVKSVGFGNLIGNLVSLNNSGTLEAQVGTLQVAGGGTNTGTLHADAGAAIQFISGTMQLDAGSASSGEGRIGPISNGVVEVVADASLANFEIAVGGTLEGASTLTLTGTFDWIGGAIDGLGVTVNQGVGIIDAPAAKSVTGGRILRNEGTMQWLGNGQLRIQQGSRIVNAAGALFDVQNTASVTGSIAPGVFENAGTFRKSVSVGSTFFSSLNPFLNSGDVEILSGVLNCAGGFTQTAGSTTLAGGDLDATLVDIQGGMLQGVGSVLDDLSNGGEVSPGAATGVGTLTVVGTYMQSPAGTLSIELAGPGDHDLLAATQPATLDGTLQVTLQGGFTPSVGDSFTVLTASSVTGSFATENLPGGVNWSVSYGADEVVLTVVP